MTVYSVKKYKHLISKKTAATTEIGDIHSKFPLLVIFIVVSVLISICFVVKICHQTIFWKMIYYCLPGANAILHTCRFFSFLTLPVSVVLALELQRYLNHTSTISNPKKRMGAYILIGLVVSGIWVEQMARDPFVGFFKSIEEKRVIELSQRIPKDASAFYVTLGPHCQILGGGGIPQVDAMLASIISGIPTINGYDSSPPPGWHLDMKDSKYPEQVNKWILDNHLGTNVFNLKIDGVIYRF